jgi:glutaredoxin
MSHNLIIFGKESCSYCDKAFELAKNQIHHPLTWVYHNTSESTDAVLDLHERKNDVKTLPAIFWNNKYVGGYTEFAQVVEDMALGSYGEGGF